MSTQSQQDKNLASGGRGWAIASNFAFGVIGMVLIGWALQEYVWPNAAPWLMLGCALAGLLGGGYRFVKEGTQAGNDSSKK